MDHFRFHYRHHPLQFFFVRSINQLDLIVNHNFPVYPICDCNFFFHPFISSLINVEKKDIFPIYCYKSSDRSNEWLIFWLIDNWKWPKKIIKNKKITDDINIKFCENINNSMKSKIIISRIQHIGMSVTFDNLVHFVCLFFYIEENSFIYQKNKNQKIKIQMNY